MMASQNPSSCLETWLVFFLARDWGQTVPPLNSETTEHLAAEKEQNLLLSSLRHWNH